MSSISLPTWLHARTEIENLQLRCKPHNGYEAEQYFGERQPWLVREDVATWQDANSVQTEL